MTTEALAVPLARRRRRPLPGLLPLLLGMGVWVAWMMVTDPVALIAAALRQGGAATYEAVCLAGVSVVGLVGFALYSVAVAAYVLAIRSLPRAS
ncbi:hypothetical protein [Longimicrobium sp.]|uniref:hypothetical protein n=1 Tax=Longimicrobium sp. TaxID=2029185 RepID=UPI002E2ECAF8|nr:hypothetical protein [Longimicrobium sp.]HEX6039603.1 hypothetical protein [Longimicrobium sp.]